MYCGEENPQNGYNWARIINDGYLRDLSPKEMLPLAGIFAGVIEARQGAGIWQAEWAKGQEVQLSEMKRIGKALLEATQPRLQQLIATTDSHPILERAKRIAETENDENGIRAAIDQLPLF